MSFDETPRPATAEEIANTANLSMWTVYEKPDDYPNEYVARRWIVGPKGQQLSGEAYVSNRLDWLRAYLLEQFPGMVRLGRSPGDDSKIVETWI